MVLYNAPTLCACALRMHGLVIPGVYIQSLNQLLAHHGRGSSPCPKCDTEFSDNTTYMMDHEATGFHMNLNLLLNFQDSPPSLLSA